LKLLPENIKETLEDEEIVNDFLTISPTVQKIRARFEKCVCIKLKTFHTAKDTITKIMRHNAEWEKTFSVIHLIKN
jgi:hypothetical protein